MKIKKWMKNTVSFLIIVILMHTNLTYAFANENQNISENTPDLCREAFLKEIQEADEEWLTQSVDNIAHQRQTTSTLVPFAISDFRTYNCRLRSICKNVEYSLFDNFENVDQEIQLLGCQPITIEPIDSCGRSNNPEIQKRQYQECISAIEIKQEMGKVFIKSVLHRDAYHKKSGIMVQKYQDIIRKIHDTLSENMRKMEGFFTEFVKRSSCYLYQCTVI